MEQPLLQIKDLAVSFPAINGNRRRVRVVQGLSLSVYPRQTLAVVGESGCGKSVTALSTMRLIPTPPGRFESGQILWSPEPGVAARDLVRLSDRAMRGVRGNEIGMVFQEPMTSLNPVYTVGAQIVEAVRLHQRLDRGRAREVAARALGEVGIADPGPRLDEYPHQMSGGMRQRVMIAMALACKPRLLLADEPTTALDVTIQAQILELLRGLQERHGMSVVLITHDLGVVAENADVVAVMYAGRVVEYGSVIDVFQNPLHPYTKGLFASMPALDRQVKRLVTIRGNVPSPGKMPPGCPFHPRCDGVQDDPRCKQNVPPLREVEPRHWAACIHAPGYADAEATPPDLAYRRQPVEVEAEAGTGV